MKTFAEYISGNEFVSEANFNPLSAYRHFGQIFKDAASKQKNAEKSDIEIAADLMRKKIVSRIMKYFGELDGNAMVAHLGKIFGSDFNSTYKFDPKFSDASSKKPWFQAIFANSDNTVAVVVKFVGNSDQMAYRMRHLPNGAENKDDFDFQWSYSVEVISSNGKKTAVRTVKCTQADAALLKTPEKLLPKAKLLSAAGK